MALTIALIAVGTLMLAGLELWLSWWLGERGDHGRGDPGARRRAGVADDEAT